MRLEDLAGRPLTYPAAGATRLHATPAGYRPAEHRLRLGSGRDRFDRAAAALLGWRMHEAAGVPTRATGVAAVGVESLGLLSVGPFTVPVPCRVVWAVETADRVGFGYGTLPGHPQSGEEAFVIDLVDDEVWFTVRAFSRVARWYLRLGTPFAIMTQWVFLHRYARALRRLSAG